ncbi:MAG TPA: c-type cytochrome [Methylomirabilota bacterium]|nr:c-type cytochrome [Methylomirabilota bacterium]
MIRSIVAAAVGLALASAAGVAVAGPVDAPGYAKAFACSACHGLGGNSTAAATPVLAGMSAWYFKKAIEDYASGRRVSAEMEPFAKMVKQQGVDDVANYFAAQPRAPREVKVDRAAVANGRKMSIVCAGCHGDEGGGDAARGVPSLQGQPAAYLKNQMLLFKADRRSPGEPQLASLKAIMKTMDDAMLADLAAYYASLGR